MIEYMNKHYSDQFNFFYSTPSNYIDAIAKLNISWPTKYDDMFPYSDTPDSYWTGYFSARANNKEYIRTASHNFHASNQLYAQKVLDEKVAKETVDQLMQVNYDMLDRIGILQHHDAVTGTAKQAVADDYSWRISTGISENNIPYTQLISDKVLKITGMQSPR
jgi:hypothetical protein